MSRFSSTVPYASNIIRRLTLTGSVGLQPGKSIWIFGAIGKTQDWDQPVSRYTLDGRYISSIVADVKNETSYNQLFAQFYNLDASYHTLLVENVNEDATLFLDYYLVEPMPPNELTKSTGDLQTGGEPLRTSISERPILTAASGPSGNIPVGSIVGAVIGGIFAVLLIAIVLFALWKRRRGTQPYYYKSAEVLDVLSDGMRQPSPSQHPSMTPSTEFESDGHEQKPDSVASTVTSRPSYPSSVHSFGSDRKLSSLFSRQTYFPLPSEYQSQKLLAKSDSTRPHSDSGSSTITSTDSSPHEQRPLL